MPHILNALKEKKNHTKNWLFGKLKLGQNAGFGLIYPRALGGL